MKIMFTLICAALLLVLAGCAGAPARGGSSGQTLGGQMQGDGFAKGSSEIVDYRQVLSEPGRF